jgi:DNA-binding MarR family transcriptional regulator
MPNEPRRHAEERTMTASTIEELARALKVLADPTRLRLVKFLARGEHGTDELAAMLGLTPPTVSHHLARLRALDLLRVRPEGTQRWYSLDAERFTQLTTSLLSPGSLTEARDDRSWEQRVVDRYIQHGVLVQIPAQRKKRAVILDHLATRFDRGREYGEIEVNRVLGALHEDVATLRRELVMARLLERSDGRYWRTDRDRAFEPKGHESLPY